MNSTTPTVLNHGITACEEVLRSAALLLPHHCQFEAKAQNAQNAERSWRCLTHPTVATVLCPEANISPCWAEDCHSVFDLGRRRAVMNERNPVCCVHCGLVVGVHGRVVVGIGGGVFSDVAEGVVDEVACGAVGGADACGVECVGMGVPVGEESCVPEDLGSCGVGGHDLGTALRFGCQSGDDDS